MANNPNVQTNFTASDMLGAKKQDAKVVKKATVVSPVTSKTESPARSSRSSKNFVAPQVKAEFEVPEALEVVAEEVPKSEED